VEGNFVTPTHYLLSTTDVAKLRDAYQQVLLRMEFPPAEIDIALAILAALRAEPDMEPVATMHESPDAVWFTKGRDDDEYACEVVHTFCYTAPQSTVPLTNQQIDDIMHPLTVNTPWNWLVFAREIEAHHGISQPKTGE
jgi:hypothetical protein